MGEQPIPHGTPINGQVDSSGICPIEAGVSRIARHFNLSISIPKKLHLLAGFFAQGFRQPGGRVFSDGIIGEEVSVVKELEADTIIRQSDPGD
jgi:hypothetical protein